MPFGEDVRDKAPTYDRKLRTLLDGLAGRDIGAGNTLYPDAGDLADRIWQATFSAPGGHRAGSARRHTWVWQTNSTQPLTTSVESERSCSDPL